VVYAGRGPARALTHHLTASSVGMMTNVRGAVSSSTVFAIGLRPALRNLNSELCIRTQRPRIRPEARHATCASLCEPTRFALLLCDESDRPFTAVRVARGVVAVWRRLPRAVKP
jgi:hypothetical protein